MHFKVKTYAFDKLTPLDSGAIGRTSSKKTKAMTRGKRAKTMGSDSGAPGPASSTGPSTVALERSIPQRLDALEATVHGIEASVHSMAVMMKGLFVDTFPGRNIPGGPPPPAAGSSGSIPSTSTVVEVDDDEDDSEEEVEGESDFDQDDDSDDDGDGEEE